LATLKEEEKKKERRPLLSLSFARASSKDEGEDEEAALTFDMIASSLSPHETLSSLGKTKEEEEKE